MARDVGSGCNSQNSTFIRPGGRGGEGRVVRGGGRRGEHACRDNTLQLALVYYG